MSDNNKSKRMTNKVALVTGGSQRIGAQIVRTLHAAGYTVVLHYCASKQSAEILAAELNNLRDNSARCFAANLNNIDSINTLANFIIDQFGRIDVLVNNASRFYPTPIGTITAENWDDLINSNVKGAFFLSQALAKNLKKNTGCIINIVDIYAEKPLQKHPVYSIAKAALAMMTRTLAKELAPEIRVNGISPGAIIWPKQSMSDEQQSDILNRIPLKRTGSSVDIANSVLFLAQDNSYITGQILAVDGGRSLNI